jgi:glycosyltransferase involved in cell wall biosynthesis
MRTGFIHATGDFVGIQDADAEYNPCDYLTMLEPLVDGRADVVYGSRYLCPDTRRVLYFWHTWMNKTLTSFSEYVYQP